MSNDEKSLLSNYKKLNPEDKAKLLSFVIKAKSDSKRAQKAKQL